MSLYQMDAVALKIAPQAHNALNGIVSNTLATPKNAFLDKQGRIIATCWQTQINSEDQIIVVMNAAKQALLQHLEKMLMFSEAKVSEYSPWVYFDLEGSAALQEGEFAISERVGCLVVAKSPRNAEIDVATFTQFRLQHAIALQGIDYTNEMLLNLHDDGYVSYQKGCFLGQEIIARVHYKSKPPRRLTVINEEECDAGTRAAMTSVIADSQGQRRGFLFVKNEEKKS